VLVKAFESAAGLNYIESAFEMWVNAPEREKFEKAVNSADRSGKVGPPGAARRFCGGRRAAPRRPD